MKLKRLFKLAGLTLLIPAFASCSLLGNNDEKKLVSIDECTWVTEDTGETIVTITYTDEEKEPTVITIPQGKTGENGVSIISVEAVLDEETGLISGLLITYSDGSEETIPASIKSIKEIHQSEDADGNLVLTIEFTDGSLSDPYTILKGQSGVGIDEIQETDNEDGSIDLLIVYTDGNSKEVHIPAPLKGDDGIGITHIESGTLENEYYITIYYSNGTNETLKFDIPSQWHNVQEKPSPNDFNNGDYAFDIIHHNIYFKDEDGTWILVASFDSNETVYTVSFDLNASDAAFASGKSEYNIYNGHSFLSSHYELPLATRPGYTFGGWSTSKTPNPTNGLFTDLTTVQCDMKLYAIWE